ncbi:hypothetical protein GQ42DRAFT_81301 [Ramicandelaber brevisporus]|nr:hypothetical protein GQ42DRAFT_81301 [Ramicandelaber brevisporus]
MLPSLLSLSLCVYMKNSAQPADWRVRQEHRVRNCIRHDWPMAASLTKRGSQTASQLCIIAVVCAAASLLRLVFFSSLPFATIANTYPLTLHNPCILHSIICYIRCTHSLHTSTSASLHTCI